MTDLTALLERVREAPSGDVARLSAAVFCYFNPEWEPSVQFPRSTVQKVGVPGWTRGFEPVASSLDAAVALCDRIQPEWAVDVTRFRHTGLGKARLWQNYDGLREHFGEGKTPALALLAALLASLVEGE